MIKSIKVDLDKNLFFKNSRVFSFQAGTCFYSIDSFELDVSSFGTLDFVAARDANFDGGLILTSCTFDSSRANRGYFSQSQHL